MSDEIEIETTAPVENSPIWMMLFIGLAMFLIGLAAGYFGRPLLAKEENTQQVADADTAPVSIPQADVPSPAEASQDAQEMMSFLIEETRHFQGNPDAPVTIIEFSDFQ